MSGRPGALRSKRRQASGLRAGEPRLMILANPLPYVQSEPLQRGNPANSCDVFKLRRVNSVVRRAYEQPQALCTGGLW
jgi:hypothetical protein